MSEFSGPRPKRGWFNTFFDDEGQRVIGESFFLEGEEFAFQNIMGSYTLMFGSFAATRDKKKIEELSEEELRKRKLRSFE